MKKLISALVLVTSSIVAGQRGSFAGTRPIGFPDTPNRTTTTPDPLADRFGDGTPDRLPIEANGDWDLVDRLSKLPIDKQPFWFINWQAYEKQRKDPQTYPQRPNPFLEPNRQINANSGQVNNGFSTPTPGFTGTEASVILNRFGSTAPSQLSNNAGTNSNFNNNAYPISNMYPSSNVYPNVNSNSNVYPSGNNNPASNIYNNNNPYSNVYPTGNPISNVFPTGNPISNVYPTGNPNSNVYPTGNDNSNVYPTGNPNSNVYPTGNANSNVYQTSNLNSHSNSGAVTKNGASFQTTQKYHWEQYFMSSNVATTNLNKYPEYYPRTDTYPQKSGHALFY